MKSLIRFTFHVSLVSALLIGADLHFSGDQKLIPVKSVISKKFAKKAPCKALSTRKRKVFVVKKVFLVEKNCIDGYCTKRVRASRVTRTN